MAGVCVGGKQSSADCMAPSFPPLQHQYEVCLGGNKYILSQRGSGDGDFILSSGHQYLVPYARQAEQQSVPSSARHPMQTSLE